MWQFLRQIFSFDPKVYCPWILWLSDHCVRYHNIFNLKKKKKWKKIANAIFCHFFFKFKMSQNWYPKSGRGMAGMLSQFDIYFLKACYIFSPPQAKKTFEALMLIIIVDNANTSWWFLVICFWSQYFWRQYFWSQFVWCQIPLKSNCFWSQNFWSQKKTVTSGEFLPNHPPPPLPRIFAKRKGGGGDLEVTQISYRKKNVKIFPLRGKEGVIWKELSYFFAIFVHILFFFSKNKLPHIFCNFFFKADWMGI